MNSPAHNEIFQSFKFSQDFSWMKDQQVFHDEEDLVFLCSKTEVGVGVCTAFAMFPHLQEVFKGFSSNFFNRKGEKIYVTLDSVDPEILKHLIHCFSRNKEFTMSLSVLSQVKDLLKMFGSNLNNFNIVKLKAKTQEGEATREEETAASTEATPPLIGGNDQKPLALPPSSGKSKTTAAAINQPAPSETEEKSTEQVKVKSSTIEIEAKEKLPLAATESKAGKKKGSLQRNKRKINILEAVENIAAKRRAREPNTTSQIGATTEVRAEDSEKCHEAEVAVKNSHSGEDSKKSQVKEDIGKILPHLKVTPLVPKASSGDAESEGSKVEVEGEVKCQEYACRTRTPFRTRSDFLHHLVSVHYPSLINTSYPFIKDQPCPLCPSEKVKKSISVSKHIWQKHLMTHEALLDLFRPELRSLILSLPKRQRGNTKKIALAVPEESVTLDETPADDTETDATVTTSDTTTSFIQPSSQEDFSARSLSSQPASSQERQDSTEAGMEEKLIVSLSSQELLNPLATSTRVWESKFVVKLMTGINICLKVRLGTRRDRRTGRR